MAYKSYIQIDLNYLSDLAEGDVSFIAEMIQLYVTRVPNDISKLEISIGSSDWKTVRATAHQMKSSFNHIGLKDIVPLIQSIEDSSNHLTDLDKIPEKFAKVKQICTQAVEELKTELKKLQK